MNETEEEKNFARERVSERLPTTRRGRIIEEDAAIPVKVMDLGLKGFGVITDRAYPVGSLVTLEESDLLGVENYVCEVVFCRQDGDTFHLGLHVRDREEALVFSSGYDEADDQEDEEG